MCRDADVYVNYNLSIYFPLKKNTLQKKTTVLFARWLVFRPAQNSKKKPYDDDDDLCLENRLNCNHVSFIRFCLLYRIYPKN